MFDLQSAFPKGNNIVAEYQENTSMSKLALRNKIVNGSLQFSWQLPFRLCNYQKTWLRKKQLGLCWNMLWYWKCEWSWWCCKLMKYILAVENRTESQTHETFFWKILTPRKVNAHHIADTKTKTLIRANR